MVSLYLDGGTGLAQQAAKHAMAFAVVAYNGYRVKYRYITLLKPKRLAMRGNYPNVRLNIDGELRTIH